jgi:hypothetical protein
MNKYTFNFRITTSAAVEYAVHVPPFHAALREGTLALSTSADDSEEQNLRKKADQVAHDLARSLSFEHSERFDVAYQGRHVLMPTGQQSVSLMVRGTIGPAPSKMSDSCEFEVRDAAGNVTDSSALQRERVRHAAQQRIAERAIRSAADPNLRDMLDHWSRYAADPDGRLHPLYDVLEVASRLYHGREQVASALNISMADLNALGRISNDPTILHGRHLGRSQGPHRIATESEINTCKRVARAVIDSYAAKIELARSDFSV